MSDLLRLASCNLAWSSFACVSLARCNTAPVRLAPVRSAPLRSRRFRLTSCRSQLRQSFWAPAKNASRSDWTTGSAGLGSVFACLGALSSARLAHSAAQTRTAPLVAAVVWRYIGGSRPDCARTFAAYKMYPIRFCNQPQRMAGCRSRSSPREGTRDGQGALGAHADRVRRSSHGGPDCWPSKGCRLYGHRNRRAPHHVVRHRFGDPQTNLHDRWQSLAVL